MAILYHGKHQGVGYIVKQTETEKTFDKRAIMLKGFAVQEYSTNVQYKHKYNCNVDIILVSFTKKAEISLNQLLSIQLKLMVST